MRHLALFFALGLVLFGIKRTVGASTAQERPLLLVTVPASATSSEVERSIDEAVLVNEALAKGGALIDPVVREQLLRSMRLGPVAPSAPDAQGEAPSDDARLLDRALALGVHRADPLIRKRLAFQAQQLLRASTQLSPADDSELASYLDAHQARYLEPVRVSFHQVFLSRARRAGQLERDASSVQARLVREDLSADAVHTLSDPTIFPLRFEGASEREVEARLGPGLWPTLHSAALGSWVGPASSSYGLHFVHVTARAEAKLPALTAVRARVLADYRHDRLEAAVGERVRALRARYRIELKRLPR